MTVDAIRKERENQGLPAGQGLFAADAACRSQLKSLYPSRCPSHLLGLYPCPAFPHFPRHSLRHLFITYEPYRNPIHSRSSHSSKRSVGPSPSALRNRDKRTSIPIDHMVNMVVSFVDLEYEMKRKKECLEGPSADIVTLARNLFDSQVSRNEASIERLRDD